MANWIFGRAFNQKPKQSDSSILVELPRVFDREICHSVRRDVLKDHLSLSLGSIRSSCKGGGKEMKKTIAVLVIIAMALVGMAGAANYMYEKDRLRA